MAWTACARPGSMPSPPPGTTLQPGRWTRPGSVTPSPASTVRPALPPGVVPNARVEADDGHVLPAQPGLDAEHASALLLNGVHPVAVGPLPGAGDGAGLHAEVTVR